MNGNPHDPLVAVQTEAARALFLAYVKASSGFSTEHVVTALSNLLVNALRQQCATRDRAAAAFDEIFTMTKALLMEHYSLDGRRREVFPFPQTIHPASVTLKPKIMGI